MASIKQTPSGAFQLCVKNKLLPKTLWLTFDTRHCAEKYGEQLMHAGAVRRDWALTQTELVNERYLTPIDDWARAHKTLFRSQTYSEPAVSLSSRMIGFRRDCSNEAARFEEPAS